MAFCGRCGQELEQGWKACPKCGAVLAEQAPGPAQRTFAHPRVLIAAVAALVALIAVGVVVATHSPKPVQVPDTTPTPSSSPTPSPTASVVGKQATDTATENPSKPAPISLSGKGASSSRVFKVSGGLTVFTAHCVCAKTFSVELVTASGVSQEMLVNVTGSYDGSVGAAVDGGSYTFKVEADKPWTVAVAQPRGESAAALPHTYGGRGQQFVGPFAAKSAVHLDARNGGEGNFVVEVLSVDGQSQDIPFNEIGKFTGSVVANDLSGAAFYLNVDSDGDWTINVHWP